MSGDAHELNHFKMRVVIKFLFLQSKAPKKIHAILTNIMGTCTFVCHHKNWVSQFKHGNFSTRDVPRPGQPKTVTTPEMIDQIHVLMLEGRRPDSG
jgi:hypothetical protein